MGEILEKYGIGDRLRMKEKEIKKRQLRNRGMDFVFVTKVWTSSKDGSLSYDIKSHDGSEMKMIPHEAFDFVSAKRAE